eukprot:420141-Prymnesium_polylepis.4
MAVASDVLSQKELEGVGEQDSGSGARSVSALERHCGSRAGLVHVVRRSFPCCLSLVRVLKLRTHDRHAPGSFRAG